VILARTLAPYIFLLAGIAGVVIAILKYLVWKKRSSFRMMSYFAMSVLFPTAMFALFAGYAYSLNYLVATAFYILSIWALGSIWIQASEISVPQVVDKILFWIFTTLPVIPFLVILAKLTLAIPSELFMTIFNWFNVIATGGVFLVWFVSFLAARLRTAYIFWTVTFVFYAFAAFALLFGEGLEWILASSILYLSGTLAYLYTWVNHGQNS
jgi:hypothetical protein